MHVVVSIVSLLRSESFALDDHPSPIDRFSLSIHPSPFPRQVTTTLWRPASCMRGTLIHGPSASRMDTFTVNTRTHARTHSFVCLVFIHKQLCDTWLYIHALRCVYHEPAVRSVGVSIDHHPPLSLVTLSD